MNRFLIGQYGGFDEGKLKRDFREEFYGIEACLFHNDEDVVRLFRYAEERSVRVGVHYPLRAGRSAMRDAQFLSQDDERRKEALRLVEEEMAYLSPYKPAYLLFHYPKPVLLDPRVDWSPWKFAEPAEYVLDSEISEEQFWELSERLFEWLSLKSEEYQIPIILEFDAIHPILLDSDRLVGLFQRYSKVKCCIDTCRLHFQERTDPHFQAETVIRKFAPYAELVHLSSLRVSGQAEHTHYPVLPECRPEEGWAPIEKYMKLMMFHNKGLKFHFEHRSDWISEEDLDRCYAWVKEIILRYGREEE